MSALKQTKTSIVDVDEFPKTPTQLRTFLVICNVYRRLVPNFARVAVPLNRLLRKGHPAELTPPDEDKSRAFKTLKIALVYLPMLLLPHQDHPYSIDSNSCKDQIGYALMQVDPVAMRHPI